MSTYNVEDLRGALNELRDAFGDQAGHFTCDEMDALCDIYRSAGLDTTADELLALHVDDDEPDDRHRVEAAST